MANNRNHIFHLTEEVDRREMWEKLSRQEIIEYYDEWPKHGYDETNVRGPKIAADTVISLYDSSVRSKVKVLDVGAGTGLVGEHLKRNGFVEMDALDASEGMMNEARKKKIYRNCFKEFFTADSLIHLNDYYDCIVAAGVFLAGHLEPDSVSHFIRLTKKDGHVVIVMRGQCISGQGYVESVLENMEKLEKKGQWKKVSQSVSNEFSYIKDITGLVLIFQVL
ncbi:methyltransferase-like protein 27 [Mytilus californianus]|uniref:methyltransferase-like protein 27 n=1 Tax=Mytilus californianus TaxID=6549 RepID=UPI002245C2D5|nr:methyltransferase-like protein 27 [Mytilus californianus]XP_052082516.1 methyltransferase-like protein 27 [Mytilus californianus]XP_052082518.1 methyltransferase-like protein 27 [Mytilus californianus]XP_052082519.1 methyltransferase-like protein 27 [Mytilus californianus]XP_052082520.1 methyltransferase-like protein 27 [Mytilus californianus]XP_052082521.1 methyltransferase-like protein 27 [Mytilus californianus]